MKLEIDYTPPNSYFNRHFTFEEDFKEMLEAGINCAKNGKNAEARYLLLRVAEAEPDNETAWMWLASISEYPEELLLFLKNVLRINPENQRAIEWMTATKSMLATTFVNRGIDAAQDNRKEFAVQCFMQALKYDDNNELAWLSLASNADSAEEKKAHLKKVLEINPENETALASLNTLKHQLSESLLKQANFAAIAGDRAAARGFLEKAMREAPDLEEAWILKAYLADNTQEKIVCYEKVLQLNPENEAAQVGLDAVKASMQKDSEKKSNAEMLRNVFEASGAEVLYAGSSTDLSQAVSSNPSKQNAEYAMEEQPAEHYEIADSEEKFVSESCNNNGFAHDPSESPTDELNADFVEEIKAQGAFAEESEGFIAENFSEQIEPASKKEADEDPVFGSFEQSDKAQAGEEESDEILQFVKDAEARVFQSEEDEPLYFEGAEEELEEDESFSYQLPEASEGDNSEKSEELQSHNKLPSVDELPQYEFSDESAFQQQSFSDKTETKASDSNLSENALTSAQPAAFENSAQHLEATDQTEESFEGNTDENPQPQSALFQCSFCYAMNELHAVICCSCHTMLSLSDMETLLSYAEADHQLLERAIENLENQITQRTLSANELTNLGIAYLNIKDLHKALDCLQEASRLSPNDVVLASKANFLAIRLAETETHESKTEETAVRSLTVMVVDDSATIRKLISGKLEKCGHTVVTAADGAEALGKIKQVVPDLILLDIMMPQMDGYQVCKLIRSNEPTKNVPVVMISGKDGFFDKVRGRMAGTTGYITKPFGPETLMKTIETYVP